MSESVEARIPKSIGEDKEDQDLEIGVSQIDTTIEDLVGQDLIKEIEVKV